MNETKKAVTGEGDAPREIRDTTGNVLRPGMYGYEEQLAKSGARNAERVSDKENAKRAYAHWELTDDTVRCPNHRSGGATHCPRGGAALQIWQRQQWGD